MIELKQEGDEMTRLAMNSVYEEHHVAEATCLTMGVPLRLEPMGQAWEIQSLDGRVWITEENDANDYLATPGRNMHLAGRGRIVIEALTPFACIMVKKIERKGMLHGMGFPSRREKSIGIEA